MSATPPHIQDDEPGRRELIARHLRLGWGALLVFLTLGVALEAFHGFKASWYLDPAHETRRLMWTLAHAHGALLGLVHVALAATVAALGRAPGALASRGLTAASILLPVGFFLGGIGVQGGDPGPGVVLAPIGALCLLVAVASTLRAVGATPGGRR